MIIRFRVTIELIIFSQLLSKHKAGYSLRKDHELIKAFIIQRLGLKLYGKTDRELYNVMNTVTARMEFGITKCYIFILKKEEYSRSELTDQKMKEINIEENYAYFGIPEVDGIKDATMKERIKVEYFSRLPKIFKSTLSNTISAINSRSVSNNIIYSAGE